MSDRFEFNGVDLPLFDHDYNTTIKNERAIEIPIAMWWLNDSIPRTVPYVASRGLEVGNVLSHYFPDALGNRRIVDRYEINNFVENVDVFDIQGEFDYIFAISTIEHVRWDSPEERKLNGAADALHHLLGLLAPGGKMLVTIPFGSNPGMDYAILHGEFSPRRQTVMMRVGGLWHETTSANRWECRGSEWHQAESIWWERYGKSTPWADAVWVGEFVA